MPSLSASKFDTLRTCPRLYYFQHVLFLERAQTGGARRFGDLLHVGLEAWWKLAGAGDAPWADPVGAHQAGLAAIRRSAMDVRTDPYEHERARRMFNAYALRWEDFEFELLEGQRGGVAVESWFSVDLRDFDGHVIPGWRMNGKKDGIARFHGVPRIVEHKSTSLSLAVDSAYWEDLRLAMQPSIYLDAAASYLREPVDGVLYDVARKPDIKPPMMATPEAEREYTLGKNCTDCGGSNGGKKGKVKGTGVTTIRDPLQPEDEKPDLMIEAPCGTCGGTGMSEQPKLYARCRDKDETVEEYGERLTAALAAAPDAHYTHTIVRRSEEQLAAARNDVAQAAREIDGHFDTMRRTANDRAHLAWPRNHRACRSQYGRRCDFIEACTQHFDPRSSQLYSIRPKQDVKGAAK
jgi:hypothetical protein